MENNVRVRSQKLHEFRVDVGVVDRVGEASGSLPSGGKVCDGSVKSAFDGAEGDLQGVGDLAVTQPLEVTQEEDLAVVRGHAVDNLFDEQLSLIVEEVFVGGGGLAFEEIDDRSFTPLARTDWG